MTSRLSRARSDGAPLVPREHAREGRTRRGDLDGHLADNADSISFMTSRGPVVGKQRTADALRRSFFRDGQPIQQLRFEQVTIRRLGKGYALVVGRFVLEGGGQPEHSGWFSTIWERQAEGWRVIHDHSS